MVEIKTEFELERHRNVVLGLCAALIFLTARIIAGCYIDLPVEFICGKCNCICTHEWHNCQSIFNLFPLETASMKLLQRLSP